MKYQFTLERKAILGFGLGLCMAGALVFADGVLVGMGLYRHSVVPLLLAAQKPAPTVTVTNRAPAPPPTATTPAAATATAATPAAVATVAAAGVAGNVCGVALQAVAPGAGAAGFALQLGSFQDAANATRLAADLNNRGCSAVVSQVTDASHRVWNVVRIGPFDNLEDAARAAAEMRRTQGLLALVRPVRTI